MTEAMKNRSRKRWKLCAGILLLCAVLGVSIYYGVTVSNAATITVGTVATNSSPLSVRKGPGTSYTKIGSLTKGSQVTIIGEEGDWYKILFGSGEGYVYKTYRTASARDSGTGVSSLKLENTDRDIHKADTGRLTSACA